MSVLSVQRKTITLTAGGGAGSADITVSDIANCVPFLSKYTSTVASPWDHFEETSVDVYFATGPDRVIAETSDDTTRVMVVEIGVVEFDGTDIEVNSGTYQIADASLSTTADPGLTDMDNAFLIHTWQVTGTPSNFRENNIRGVVTSESALTFDRATSGGVIDGHWYTVESTDGSFSVQHEVIHFTTTQNTNTATIDSVAKNKTFLVGSWNNGGADDVVDSSIDVVLTNETTITATRSNTGSSTSLDWAGQAVTFAGSEVVLRGSASDITATTGDLTLSDTIGTLANCTIATSGNTGSMCHGRCAGSSSQDVTEAQVAWTLLDEDTVQYNRITVDAETATVSYEVIEWDVGGAAPAARRVMVIS